MNGDDFLSSRNVLEVRNLTKEYRSKFLFSRRSKKIVIGCQDVSFSVTKGEIFGFLGPNGAGKTTVIRSILDYLRIKSGAISVLGFDHHAHRNEIRKYMGYIPGDMWLFGNYSGEEFLDHINHFRRIDPDFLELLKTNFHVDLKKKIRTLSKGNRQQVGIIAALSSKPKLLILDEPTSGLDPLMVANFHNLLNHLKNEGTTIFLSSHDLAEVHKICDRVAIIKYGKIVHIGSIEDLQIQYMQNAVIEFDPKKAPTENELTRIPSVISVHMLSQNTFSLSIKEDINGLFQFLANHSVKRFTCEDASLEEIFLHFYQ
ncbi:MAG: ATP-binding cassette domain-containing protein [Candidatus Odinarchaeota archaeon]